MTEPSANPAWYRYEAEVSHYFQHEPGAHSPNLDPDHVGGGGDGPKEPAYPPGADYYTMVTVQDRMAVADQLMPFVPAHYRTVTEPIGKHGTMDRQHLVDAGSPSASMVLRAKYGNTFNRWLTLLPNGHPLLDAAESAYIEAAARVLRRRGPTATERLERAWKRVFG